MNASEQQGYFILVLSFCLFIGLLVWFDLKLGYHTPLSAIQSTVALCKLHNAKCLGSEGMWDKDFFSLMEQCKYIRDISGILPLKIPQAWYTSHSASYGCGWSLHPGHFLYSSFSVGTQALRHFEEEAFQVPR